MRTAQAAGAERSVAIGRRERGAERRSLVGAAMWRGAIPSSTQHTPWSADGEVTQREAHMKADLSGPCRRTVLVFSTPTSFSVEPLGGS